MGLYEVPLSMFLLGFGMGTMLANIHMCGIMLLLPVIKNLCVYNSNKKMMLLGMNVKPKHLFLICSATGFNKYC